MPRPKKTRFVSQCPTIAAFVPQGIEINGIVHLSVEELEAIRLSDHEGLDQESAANLMQVSRQTYGRILAMARHKISEALIDGKTLKITGGNFAMRSCGRCHRQRGRKGKACRAPMGELGAISTIQQKGKETTMSKQVTIDQDECLGCGACVEICPEVFGLDEDSTKAFVLDGADAGLACVEEAMGSCPVECITVEDE